MMERYIKKKKIGEGSFGIALLVQSKADGKNYVIKEINISKMKRKEKEEAKKEVSVLRKMKHPNIVSYTESFEELGNLYIVMDYCDGGDLYQQINARRGVLIQEDKIMDWFVQICLALKHVHDRKILHRDIKSQNIFLTSKGIIKMGDFGIARVLNNTMELARTCIGTPYYLSPEICENKPYNNKSDIWALGCVLYELCTLKHAFEAGNMKNLVLKIIRGSYPPVSPRYSYDLRNLVNQLFKRNPRDRPSVNTILKKNFIMKRIRKYLTDHQIQDEFNDTTLPIAREGQSPRVPVAAKRPADRVSEGVRISAPAAKYGAPMRRKPQGGARRPPSGDRDKKSIQAELDQKKRDLVAKEKQRRQKEMHFKAQKQKLVEKQKLLQMQKAREAGWKHTLSSNGSNGSSSGVGGGGGGGHHVHHARPLPQPKLQPQPAAEARRGNYDHYHQYLDNINVRQRADGGVGNVALFREEQKRRIHERPVSASAAEAARRAELSRNIAANAADRAGVVSEFLARKREAEANKLRAGFQMGWHPPQDVEPDRPLPQPAPAAAANVSKEDADYMEKLKAIRMQNFKQRQIIQQKMVKDSEGSAVRNSLEGPRVDAEERRKKIEALKAQADERAAKLKEQLERQRRELFEREQRQWQEHLARKRNLEKNENASSVPVETGPVPGPATPGVSMTGVLHDVGVDIKPPEPQQEDSVAEKHPKGKGPNDAAAERKRWGGGGDGNNLNLADLPLQETSSKMDATSAADVVTRYDDKKSTLDNIEKDQPKQPAKDQAPRKKWGPPAEPPESKEPTDVQSNRKKWNAPGDTVVGLLQNAAIQPMTMTMAKGGSDTVGTQGSPLGVTMVKESGTVSSKTIVIKEGDHPTESDLPQASSTPVSDKPPSELIPAPSNEGSGSDSTTGEIDEESDTSTHLTTTTEGEPSTDSHPPREGGGAESETDSGMVSVTTTSPGNKGDAVAGEKTFVPSIRPMSAPSTNKHKSDEIEGLVEEEGGASSRVTEKIENSEVLEQEALNNNGNIEVGIGIKPKSKVQEEDDSIQSGEKTETLIDILLPDRTADIPNDVMISGSLENDSAKHESGEVGGSASGGDGVMKAEGEQSVQAGADRIGDSDAKPQGEVVASLNAAGTVTQDNGSGGNEVQEVSKDVRSGEGGWIGREKGPIGGTKVIGDGGAQLEGEGTTSPDTPKAVTQDKGRGDDAVPEVSKDVKSGGDGGMGREKRPLGETKVIGDSGARLVGEGATSLEPLAAPPVDDGGDEEAEAEMMDMEEAYKEALGSNAAEDDEDSSSDSLDPSEQANKSVVSGLSTGTFDADSRLLRTCSLPDLSKLFRTTLAFNPFFEVEQQALAITGRPEEDGSTADNDDGNESDDERDDVPDGRDQNEDEDEEEAYQHMVESMKHLLEAVDGTDQREGNGSPEPPLTAREGSSPTGDEEESDSRPINEDWDSGEGSYDDDGEDEGDAEGDVDRRVVDDEEESESVFLRLEESRMELEHELGCDSFLRAYRAVQAIHEDEDENIDEGTQIVREILGSGKQHLYTKILQLVMADGAYTEDNE